MNRVKLPDFIHEVIDDPHQRGILAAGALSMIAVGLVPRVLSPGLPTAQEAIRLQPQIQDLFLLLAFASTATVIAGGLVSDIVRRRWLLLGGLAVMVAASLVALAAVRDVVFYAANFVNIAASGVVLAYAIGSVAVAYEGIPRATALGIVYAAFGAGTAAQPALLTFFPSVIPSTDPAVLPSFTFDTRLAYLTGAIVAAIALWAARRYMPTIPGSLPAQRTLIVSIAVWSVAILAIVSGVLGVFGPGNDLVPAALVVLGVLVLGTIGFRFRRTMTDWGELRLDQRGLGAALAVGVGVGFAQAVPLMLLPQVFEYALDYGTIVAIVAIAPFALALLVTGPVAGELIRRFGPRGMMTGGAAFLGVANIGLALGLAWISDHTRAAYTADPSGSTAGLPELHYGVFIIPLILVGAGFVLATTVRTAIVFASTPRGLPGSAAAVNEASVSLGSRVGIVAATSILATRALGSAREMVAGRPDADALVAEFQAAFTSLGTPRFQEVSKALLEGAPPIKRAAYGVAYLDGVVVALVVCAIVSVGTAVVAWALMGRRDPIRAVFDMQDERDRVDYVPTGERPGD